MDVRIPGRVKIAVGVWGKLPSLPHLPWTLTDGHVVATVGEARVPIAELCLVAGVGALRLTSHWI